MQAAPPVSPVRSNVTDVALLRILGVAFGLAVVIGTSIGAGILRAPGPVIALTQDGPVALLLWGLGGVFALLGAAALCELATMLPRSGGLYVFARRALGEGFGFTIGCADWFANCSAVAYGAVAGAEFTAKLIPALSSHVTAVAAGVIVSFAGLQMLGLRVSSRVQEVVSFVKAAAFFVLVAGLLLVTGDRVADGAAVAAATAPSRPYAVVLILAMQFVVIAYDGWQSATYFAGEDRDPARDLPRALLGGVLIVVAIYLLMNVALLRVLSPQTLAASTLPAADAARVLMGGRGETIITALSILSPLTLVSAVLLCAPRILYAMSVDGLILRRAAYVDRRGTPSISLAVSTAAALLMLASGGSFEAIVTVGALFTVLSYTGAFVSLLVLRAREPALARPFRAWGSPWSVGAVLLISVGLILGTVAGAPRESAIAAVVLVALYPVYRLTRRSRILVEHR